MTLIFRPPYRWFDPPVLPSTPLEQQSPAKYFKDLIPAGVNVWLTTAGVVTEKQPPQWSDVAFVWYGGHDNPVSASDAALLIAANPDYAACITDDTPVIPPTPPAGGSGFGTDSYGADGYGV
jgi:hypothetical protein